MYYLKEVFTEESIHPKCPYRNALLKFENEKAKSIQDKIIEVGCGITTWLHLEGKSFREDDVLDAFHKLVYVNTIPSKSYSLASITNNIEEDLAELGRVFMAEEFCSCVDVLGLYKTLVLCMTDFFYIYVNSNEKDKIDLNALYLATPLFFSEEYCNSKWNIKKTIKEFAMIDFSKYGGLKDIQATSAVLHFLLIFDSPFKVQTMLDALGDTANFFLRLIGGLEGELPKTESKSFLNLLSMLNDMLKGISKPDKRDLYGAIFNDQEGLSQAIIKDIADRTIDNEEYYYEMSRYFGYAIQEYELRTQNIKPFM